MLRDVNTNVIPRALKHRLVFFALALLLSVHFSMSYARALPPAFPSLYNFAYGPIDVAYRPRVLMRWLSRFGYYLSHDQRPSFAHGAMSAQEVEIFLVALVALMGVIYLTRASIRLLTESDSKVEWLALLVVPMCNYQYLLTPQIRAQFVYDVPCVAVFAIGIYAILSNQRWLYYLIFIVGTFNRETTLFLPPLFIILALDQSVPLLEALKRMSVWRYVEAVLQIGLWAGIVHWCNVTTDAVLGPTWAVPENTHFMLSPIHWPTLLSVYGFLWIPYVLWFRRIAHVNLERVALVFPFWFAAMYWKADFLEIRVEAEWIPYLTICLALIARNMLLVRDDTVLPGQTPLALPGTAVL
jgi:hypothetical protein